MNAPAPLYPGHRVSRVVRREDTVVRLVPNLLSVSSGAKGADAYMPVSLPRLRFLERPDTHGAPDDREASSRSGNAGFSDGRRFGAAGAGRLTGGAKE